MTTSIRLAERFGTVWFDLAAPHLQSMADGSGGRFLRADIEDRIAAGDYQLWPIVTAGKCVAAVVTQVIAYPRLRACRLIGCAGSDRADWLPLHAHIADWARGQNCTRMEAMARPGWARVLAPLGYRTFHMLLEGDVHAPEA